MRVLSLDDDLSILIWNLRRCPSEEILEFCRTKLQFDVWAFNKRFWLRVRSNFISYFTQSKLLTSSTEEEKLADDWSLYYIYLFEALDLAWEEIEQELKKIVKKWVRIPVGSPGTLLSLFILLGVCHELNIYFSPYVEYNSRKIGEILRGKLDLRERKNQNLVVKYKEWIWSPHDPFVCECLEVLKEAGKRNKNLRKKLNKFYAQNSSLIAQQLTCTHPRNAPKAVGITNGSILPLS